MADRNYGDSFNKQKAAPAFNYVWDNSLNGGSGAYRPLNSSDFSSTIGDVNITGDLLVNTDELEDLTRSGNNYLASISGDSESSSQLLSQINQSLDTIESGIGVSRPSGYQDNEFMTVGGIAVDTANYIPNYESGDAVVVPFDKDNGAQLINQADLDKSYDSVEVWAPKQTSTSNSAPSGVNGVALVSNSERKSWMVQNVGMNPLYVKLGNLPINQSSYSFILAGGSSSGDGRGASWFDEEGRWTGTVCVSGESEPAFIIWEA